MSGTTGHRPAVDFPSVRPDTPAIEAARLLAGQHLPGLIVVHERGRPTTVLPGTDVRDGTTRPNAVSGAPAAGPGVR